MIKNVIRKGFSKMECSVKTHFINHNKLIYKYNEI